MHPRVNVHLYKAFYKGLVEVSWYMAMLLITSTVVFHLASIYFVLIYLQFIPYYEINSTLAICISLLILVLNIYIFAINKKYKTIIANYEEKYEKKLDTRKIATFICTLYWVFSIYIILPLIIAIRD